jgi:hypothetical protein
LRRQRVVAPALGRLKTEKEQTLAGGHHKLQNPLGLANLGPARHVADAGEDHHTRNKSKADYMVTAIAAANECKVIYSNDEHPRRLWLHGEQGAPGEEVAERIMPKCVSRSSAGWPAQTRRSEVMSTRPGSSV